MNILRHISVEGGPGYHVQVPDCCPICHRHSEVQFAGAWYIEQGKEVQAAFRCVYQPCRQLFFCYYGANQSPDLNSVRPVKPDVSAFPEAVTTISPLFVDIYREAEESSALGLKNIAGPGYRKAFEVLIKEYAKSRAPPEKATEIEHTFAGTVVNKYIDDTRIQAVAKRSLWLGNDESHYLRKWEDKDVNDLVTLISLTAHTIDIEKRSAKYIEDMPE